MARKLSFFETIFLNKKYKDQILNSSDNTNSETPEITINLQKEDINNQDIKNEDVEQTTLHTNDSSNNSLDTIQSLGLSNLDNNPDDLSTTSNDMEEPLDLNDLDSIEDESLLDTDDDVKTEKPILDDTFDDFEDDDDDTYKTQVYDFSELHESSAKLDMDKFTNDKNDEPITIDLSINNSTSSTIADDVLDENSPNILDDNSASNSSNTISNISNIENIDDIFSNQKNSSTVEISPGLNSEKLDQEEVSASKIDDGILHFDLDDQLTSEDLLGATTNNNSVDNLTEQDIFTEESTEITHNIIENIEDVNPVNDINEELNSAFSLIEDVSTLDDLDFESSQKDDSEETNIPML